MSTVGSSSGYPQQQSMPPKTIRREKELVNVAGSTRTPTRYNNFPDVDAEYGGKRIGREPVGQPYDSQSPRRREKELVNVGRTMSPGTSIGNSPASQRQFEDATAQARASEQPFRGDTTVKTARSFEDAFDLRQRTTATGCNFVMD